MAKGIFPIVLKTDLFPTASAGAAVVALIVISPAVMIFPCMI